VRLHFISRGLAGLIPVGDPTSEKEFGACKAKITTGAAGQYLGRKHPF